jgi:DNA-directed RNA polymerase specialized sigma24 family protein
MHYTELTDERLAALHQQGDDDAFSTLFLRYQKALQRHSYLAAQRYEGFSEDEFLSNFQERFIRLVTKYDYNICDSFAGYCKLTFARMAYSYVQDKITRRGYVDGKKVRIDDKTKYRKQSAVPVDLAERELSDIRYTYEYEMKIEDTDLYKYLASVSDEQAKLIALLVKGESYEQIALAFGRTGNYMALANWGKRAVKRVRKSVIEFYDKNDCLDEVNSLVI